MADVVSEQTPLLRNGHVRSQSHRRSRSSDFGGGDFEEDDIDSRFRRWKETVARRFRKGKFRAAAAQEEPSLLISVFEGDDEKDGSLQHDSEGAATGAAESWQSMTEEDLFRDVEGVKTAIEDGVYPKMITTGSSGSYFARLRDPISKTIKTCAVFKPWDEEPYGNLNPKRAFLRRYFWWAMGRPCLIAGFSAMSEAGASLLDDRLQLGMVPKTRLVNISSPSFHYHYKDRMAWEHDGTQLPEKMGSFQTFLHGYVNASTFLRQHPLPSRPRSVLERDLAAEQRAHKKARKKYKARLRKCGVRLKYFLLCRQGFEDLQYDPAIDGIDDILEEEREEDLATQSDSDFYWTADLIHSFRLELEKLVVFDYLCRNTDRGLDNFMVRHIAAEDTKEASVRLGAIDNSLAWPIKHPDGIRDYPFGWLFLPADLIGGPFSASTRSRFLPILTSPKWWYETEEALRQLFKQDECFDEKLFQSQMALFKGQGWNLVQSLRNEEEGPIELVARSKKVVHRTTSIMTQHESEEVDGGRVALTAAAARRQQLVRSHSQQTRQSEQPARALPMTIGRDTQPTIQLPDSGRLSAVGAQPQSLPETSGIVRPPARPSGPSTGGQSFLGIEVLESMRKASKSKSNDREKGNRPPIVNGYSYSGSVGRSADRGLAPNRGSKSPRLGVDHQGLASPQEEDEDEEARRQATQNVAPGTAGVGSGRANLLDRMASSDYFVSRHHHGRDRSGTEMSTSSSGSEGRATGPSDEETTTFDAKGLPSIASALAGSSRGKQEDLIASTASLPTGRTQGSFDDAPAKSSRIDAAATLADHLNRSNSDAAAEALRPSKPVTSNDISASPGRPPIRIGHRRGMSSVGEWASSFTSTFSLGGNTGGSRTRSYRSPGPRNFGRRGRRRGHTFSHDLRYGSPEEGDLSREGSGGVGMSEQEDDDDEEEEEGQKTIKVLVDTLVDVTAMPWQAWLRA